MRLNAADGQLPPLGASGGARKDRAGIVVRTALSVMLQNLVIIIIINQKPSVLGPHSCSVRRCTAVISVMPRFLSSGVTSL